MGDSKEQPKGKVDPTSGKGANRIFIPTGRLMTNNFLGGIAWGVGTVIGATVVVAAIVLILNQLDSVPVLGDFLNDLTREIQRSNQ